MVAEQVMGRGVRDPRVLDAMRRVPREHFLDAALASHAYEDRPLSIGHGQTISQPYIVARMCELAALAGTERVLEIGAGCGYAAAVLGRLAARVVTLEILPALAALAQRRLAALPARNVAVVCGDGTLGYASEAPYDAILVAAGAPRVPGLLLTQLADGGRLIIPVGEREDQRLLVIARSGDEFATRQDSPVRFVDLTGRYGWGGSGPPQA